MTCPTTPGVTHHAGCACHEERHAEEVRALRDALAESRRVAAGLADALTLSRVDPIDEGWRASMHEEDCPGASDSAAYGLGERDEQCKCDGPEVAVQVAAALAAYKGGAHE